MTIAKTRARYAKGALLPLEPLDLEEAREVLVTIEDEDGAAPASAFRVVTNRIRFASGGDPAEIKQFLC